MGLKTLPETLCDPVGGPLIFLRLCVRACGCVCTCVSVWPRVCVSVCLCQPLCVYVSTRMDAASTSQSFSNEDPPLPATCYQGLLQQSPNYTSWSATRILFSAKQTWAVVVPPSKKIHAWRRKYRPTETTSRAYYHRHLRDETCILAESPGPPGRSLRVS